MGYAVNMAERERPMIRGHKAQVTAEFTVALLALVLFLVMTTRLFVWMGGNIVGRNKAFEGTRKSVTVTNLPPMDFYNKTNGNQPLDLFKAIK